MNSRTELALKVFEAFHDFIVFDDHELRYVITQIAGGLSDSGLEMLISDLKKLLKERKKGRKALAKASAKIIGVVKEHSGSKKTVRDLVKLLQDLSAPPRTTNFLPRVSTRAEMGTIDKKREEVEE